MGKHQGPFRGRVEVSIDREYGGVPASTTGRMGGATSISRSSLLVYLPSLSCILEHTFGLQERSIRLHGFLFDVLQSVLKGFILGLQTESEYS